jgi:hypothetical protein
MRRIGRFRDSEPGPEKVVCGVDGFEIVTAPAD